MRPHVDLLNPTFVLRDGHVMIAEEPCADSPTKFGSRTDFDAFATHIHVLDVSPDLGIPWHDDPETGGVIPDHADPRFHEAWARAKRAAHAWAATLRQQFPERAFRVYATKLQDPVVRFHALWPGEDPWWSDAALAEAVAADEAVVIATQPTGTL